MRNLLLMAMVGSCVIGAWGSAFFMAAPGWFYGWVFGLILIAAVGAWSFYMLQRSREAEADERWLLENRVRPSDELKHAHAMPEDIEAILNEHAELTAMHQDITARIAANETRLRHHMHSLNDLFFSMEEELSELRDRVKWLPPKFLLREPFTARGEDDRSTALAAPLEP